MSSLQDIFRSNFPGKLDRDGYLADVCRREGAPHVVATVADMISREDESWWSAALFLHLSDHVPELVAEATASTALHEAFTKLLNGPSTRTRLRAFGTLGFLPEALCFRLQAEAAAAYHRERDLVMLAHVPSVSHALLTDADWLVRWSAVRAMGDAVDIGKQLAADVHPLVAGEAKQRLANLAADEAKVRAARPQGGQGWTFYTPSDDRGDTLFFADLDTAFVASWPAEKTRYTLDELRAYVLAQVARS